MKILVADDDGALRATVCAVAKSLGCEPISVADGLAAWDEYQKNRADLAVLDIGMPGLDGLELCRRIRAVDPKHETFVLVFTIRSAQEDLQTVLETGADDYMSKPTTAENLRARLVIAQKRMAEEARRRATEEALARAQWLAGVGETTLALQHDINNPLSALIGHAELLLLEAQDKGADARGPQLIIDQARRIADVVRRLGGLRDPHTVESVAGIRMIDLSEKRSAG